MDPGAYLVAILGGILTFVVVLVSIRTGSHELIPIAGFTAAFLGIASGLLAYLRRPQS